LAGDTVIHALANPTRFLKLARPLTPVLFWAGVALALFGVWGGLTQTPADYLQKESVRILYIHVPAAWLGMGGWSGVAFASLGYLIWRHPLANIAARAIAPAGAVFAALCLITGSIWGRPTWGTWWEWDGRLTSMLLLFFVYIAYIALARADSERGGDGRVPALFGVAGSVLLPIVRYSVVWWNTLHQGQSIGLTSSSIDVDAVAFVLHDRRVHSVVRRRGADADARDARDAEGRGADAADGGRVNHWAFVTAAYAVTWSAPADWRPGRGFRCGSAEAAADSLRRER
jgi:heme exporter protein C